MFIMSLSILLPRDPFMILSGGLSYDTVGRRACLTVMHGKSTAVLEMDYPIVDFLTLCETPYPNGNPHLQSYAKTFLQYVFPSAACYANPLVFIGVHNKKFIVVTIT